jgi:bifunctional non-homologous end joining protein LigD
MMMPRRHDRTTACGLFSCKAVAMTNPGKDLPRGALRRILDGADDGASEPSFTFLSYIPKRRLPAAAARPRSLTLQSGFIPPCLPMTAPSAPSGPLWLHEIKHDGVRIIARTDGSRVKLYGRLGDDLTARYPLIVETMARLPPCTMDGEAVACDERGMPLVGLPQGRSRDDRTFLYAFDLIELDGEDRRRDALAHRKLDMSRLLANAGPGVRPTEWVDAREGDGPAVFAHACALGLEGVVWKRKNSRYISGRSPYWLMLKNPALAVDRRGAGEGRDQPDGAGGAEDFAI